MVTPRQNGGVDVPNRGQIGSLHFQKGHLGGSAFSLSYNGAFINQRRRINDRVRPFCRLLSTSSCLTWSGGTISPCGACCVGCLSRRARKSRDCSNFLILPGCHSTSASRRATRAIRIARMIVALACSHIEANTWPHYL